MRYMFFWLLLLSFVDGKAQSRNDIKYDFRCMGDDLVTTGISFGTDLEDALTEIFGAKVSVEEEHEIGAEAHKEIKKQYKIVESGEKLEKIKRLLRSLQSRILDPKGYKYQIYLLDSDVLNAFTVGARIYVTTKMYDFCRSDDELACIIGHEISHNELGHLNRTLSQRKAAQGFFGDLGALGAAIGKQMAIASNQKNEVACDMLGIDLAFAAQFDGCQSVALWKRMKEQSKREPNLFSKFFASHPDEGSRINCCQKHISSNYQRSCEK